VRRELYGEDHPLTIQAHFFLARRLRDAGGLEAAESELLMAREQLAVVPATGANLVDAIHSDLVKLYTLMDAPDRLRESEADLEALRAK